MKRMNQGLGVIVNLKSDVIIPGHWLITENIEIHRGRGDQVIYLDRSYHDTQGRELLDHLQTLRTQYVNFRINNNIGYIDHATGDFYPDLEHIKDTIDAFYGFKVGHH